MCILCVVQRWSRRVATMLPWLVLPLILIWAFSQFLPPSFRFEITSPRLACVLVLLGTLFWYEILMPQLSIWRARRSARIREHHRNQALELQKLRKTATRRCRNCLTAYRDQNPGGGRFMCSYCGHISKRPVLDLPEPLVKSSGIINHLVGKNGWMCSQDWAAVGNGNCVSSVPRFWIGDEQCSTEKSYSGSFIFACKLLSSFFSNLKWVCRKVFRFNLGEDGSSDGDHRDSAAKRGDNGANSQESKGEKARRKAEEKKQARLEKEMLEEEERKQREEVARLVEERRRLRDEKLQAERQHSKGLTPDGEKDLRKEIEKKKHDKRRDKDKGSNKSSSDGEDPEKRPSRESERKHDFDKKNENERRSSPRTMTELNKSHNSEVGNKVMSSKPRYFGRVTGSILSSSRGFTSGSFFGRNTQNSSTPVSKPIKPAVGFVDQGSGNKRDSQVAGNILGKATSNGDDRISGTNLHRPGGSDLHTRPATLKKAWHQLFTRSASVSPYPDIMTSSFQDQSAPPGAQSVHLTDQRLLPNNSFDNQFNLEQSMPFATYPLANGAFSNPSFSHLSVETMLPSVKGPPPTSIQEEPELFEDPCYIPDPVSLLGPVSESLDNFPLDLGTGFVSNDKIEVPRALKNVSAHGEITKPSPIESPMSRLRVPEEKQIVSGQLPYTSKSQEPDSLKLDEPSDVHGTWQMWGTPFAQDGLGLGGPASWLLPIGQNCYNQEDILHPMSHTSMLSHLPKDNHVLPSLQFPHHLHHGNHQNDGMYSPPGHGMNGNDMRRQKIPFQSVPVDGESHFLPLSLIDNIQSTFEPSPADCWSKKEWVVNGLPEEVGNSTPATQPIGSLFSTGPDVQSVWSFSQKETI